MATCLCISDATHRNHAIADAMKQRPQTSYPETAWEIELDRFLLISISTSAFDVEVSSLTIHYTLLAIVRDRVFTLLQPGGWADWYRMIVHSRSTSQYVKRYLSPLPSPVYYVHPWHSAYAVYPKGLSLAHYLLFLSRQSRQRERLNALGLSICSSVCLSVCLSVDKMRFSQKLSNSELWSLFTIYRKSYMGFSKNPLLDPWNSRWRKSAILRRKSAILRIDMTHFFCCGRFYVDEIWQIDAEWHADYNDIVEIETGNRISIWRTVVFPNRK